MNDTLFNNDKIILDLCGGTGSWSKPYKENGYDVRVIDPQEWLEDDYGTGDVRLFKNQQKRYMEYYLLHLVHILVVVVLDIGRKKVKSHY